MRIVIDFQGAQNESRFRGIGRYTVALTLGMLRNNTNHEIILALNGIFPDTIKPIYSLFEGLLPQENIRIWTPPDLVSHCGKKNAWRRQAAEVLREAFLLSLNPDVVLISSLFEGAGDSVVTSIGKFTDKIPTAVILYDLIPLLNKEVYLGRPALDRWYKEKLEYLIQADVRLAISAATRQEAITQLRLPAETVVNISTACDEKFRKTPIHPDIQTQIREQWHIDRPFVMYSGASDPRKNHIRLISAYAKLPTDIRMSHQLVLAGVMPQVHIDAFKSHAQSVGLGAGEMVITGHIDDEVMIGLYNLCKCFIFPSWHEGFGLPALEAMACGAAVIGSNTSSVPEVIGKLDALFDPLNEASITEKLNQVLTDQSFRESLIRHGLMQSKTFSWDNTAQRALTAIEQRFKTDTLSIPKPTATKPPAADRDMVNALAKAIAGLQGQPKDGKPLKGIARSINDSFPNVDSERNIVRQIRKLVRLNSRTRALHATKRILERFMAFMRL